MKKHPTQGTDPGITFIEILVATVIVGVLTSVVVVGVGALLDQGSSAACEQSAAAARVGAIRFAAEQGRDATTLTELLEAGTVTFDEGVVVPGDGTIAEGSGWTLVMNVPNATFACVYSAGDSTNPSQPGSGTAQPACTAEPSSVTVCVSDHAQGPISGVKVEVSRDGAPFLPLGTSDGGAVRVGSVAPGRLAVRFTYRGASLTLPTAARPANSVVTVSTRMVLVHLVDHASEEHRDGATIDFAGNRWQWQPEATFSGTHELELLPVSGYIIRVSFRGARQSLRLDASKESKITFRTTPITVSLTDSRGRPIEPTALDLRGNHWRMETGLFTADEVGHYTAELLPLPGYLVRATFNGAWQSIPFDASATSEVRFATVSTEIEVLDSLGRPVGGAAISHRGNLWQWQASQASTDENGRISIELLPVAGYAATASAAGRSRTAPIDSGQRNLIVI